MSPYVTTITTLGYHVRDLDQATRRLEVKRLQITTRPGLLADAEIGGVDLEATYIHRIHVWFICLHLPLK